MAAVKLGIGGSAKVYCVHDRQKRQVRDPDAVKRLGRTLGVQYDPRKHTLQLCACCMNLFVAYDDTPRLCDPCQGPPKHPLGGPLPEPGGAI